MLGIIENTRLQGHHTNINLPVSTSIGIKSLFKNKKIYLCEKINKKYLINVTRRNPIELWKEMGEKIRAGK